MSASRVRFENGRLPVDELTTPPEGSVLDVLTDALDPLERAALDAAIFAAWRSVQEGHGRSAADVLADLRER